MTTSEGTLGQPKAVQLALQLGWTITVLYGDIPDASSSGVNRLLSVHELPVRQRRELERERLQFLLQELKKHPDCNSAAIPTETDMLSDLEAENFKAVLANLNLLILKALAKTSPGIELAYELGRSIRDTVNPPFAGGDGQDSDGLVRAFERSRIAKMQDSLATLSAQYPLHAAPIVSTSIGRWAELVDVTIGPSKTKLRGKNQRAVAEKRMREHLLPQGDLWLTLLVGTLSTSGLLSPEGWVAAGQEALRRSIIIIRQVIEDYWVALTLIAVLTAGVLFLAYINLQGAAKVWTFIATIAGAIGVSTKSLFSSLGRISAQAERPIFSVAQEDAMAWAVTTLPEFNLKRSGVRQLRQAGVSPRAEISRP